MNIISLTVFLTLIPLIWAFYILWNAKNSFHSLIPFIYGAILIGIARWLDIPIEVPRLNLASWLGLPVDTINSLIITFGDLLDSVGVLFLVLGFIKTINYLYKTQNEIKTLESLLPVCAWCKKIRDSQGGWLSMEKYLERSGGPAITHGVCPDCSAKLLNDYKQKKYTSV
jgi:hypothetical protein